MRNVVEAAEVRPAEDLASLAAKINSEHAAGEEATRAGLEHYRAAGEALLKAKKQCGHGKWLAWLAKNVKCSDRQARRYMALAKLEPGSDLEEKWRELYGRDDDGAEDDTVQRKSLDEYLEESDMPGDRISLHALQRLEQEASENRDYERAAEYASYAAELQERLDSSDGDSPVHNGTLEWDETNPLPESSPPLCDEVGTPAPRGARTPMPVVDKTKTWLTVDEWQAMPAAARKKALADGAGGDSGFNRQENDSIEWAKWSWNPVSGCMHDCPYCYARDIAERFYPQKFEPSIYPARLQAPRRMRVPDGATSDLGLKNVFTCSMADLFGRWVPAEWIELVLAEVRRAPQWNFLFLTKFPIRLSEFEFPDNAWVGTTVDCQIRVANAERAFRKVRAKVKWLSCEPLIEPLKFSDLGMFQWVVIGGASGSSQTPEWLPPRDWHEALRRDALKAGCEVYEKTNLLRRFRGYPGFSDRPPAKAPESMRYLPEVETPGGK